MLEFFTSSLFNFKIQVESLPQKSFSHDFHNINVHDNDVHDNDVHDNEVHDNDFHDNEFFT